MHIDGNPMSVNAIDLYSAAQGEKAAAGERTAEVRKKLLKRSLQSEGGTTPEEALMIGHWLDSRHSQGENEDEYHASAVGIDPDFG